MELNNVEILEELRAVSDSYEQALVANDLVALDAFFYDHGDTIRYGPGENLYGARAIAEFRQARPGGPKPRDVTAVRICCFGAEFGIVNIEFRQQKDAPLGRQSQSWVKMQNGWKIVTAHVSYMDAS